MPQPRSSPDAGLDEQRLLDELEQLQLAIRETRATRALAQPDFDTQLRAFDAPATPETARSDPNPLPVAPGPVLVADAPAGLPLQTPSDDRPHGTAATPVGGAPRRARSRSTLAAVTAGITALVVAAGWMASRTPAPPQPVAPPAQPVAAPAPPVKPIPPVDPHVLRIDLTTVRRVWLRVAVDGRIALEREVAAGEQLPFGADRAIVVRAGDAGAVTVRIGGVDQGAIGGDGQVVTRAFAAPER